MRRFIRLLVTLGLLVFISQVVIAQTRAIQPVRIEALTAQEESISYIAGVPLRAFRIAAIAGLSGLECDWESSWVLAGDGGIF